MSVEQHGQRGHDRGDDIATYLLGALDPAELEEFRGHLATCAKCTEEVAALQRTADLLPMAAPQVRVPKSLRRRVMRAVAADQQRSAAGSPARRRSPRWGAAPLARPAGALAALAVVLVIA